MSGLPTRRRARLFPTAEQCESAFYEAFERCDIKGMMAVWAESDDVVCIHPNGPRVVGFDAVRESWVRVFAGAPQLRMRTMDVRRHEAQGLEVRAVIEEVAPRGTQGVVGVVFATNVYELTDGGWRMVVHHASAVPEPPAREDRQTPTHTLH